MHDIQQHTNLVDQQVNQQSSKIKTVMIMAAGTGGHVFPALAVAEKLREQGIDVHWLATSAGMEHRLVGAKNIPLHPIDIQGLRAHAAVRKNNKPRGSKTRVECSGSHRCQRRWSHFRQLR